MAFEECKGLSHLAETMGRDPSVVSRSLQRIAETCPVLMKVKGRWEITPLGRQLNVLTKDFLSRHVAILSSVENKAEKGGFALGKKTPLIVINAQEGLLDATQPGRNNTEAEKKISELLKHWRVKRLPVVHIKHVSDDPSSIFYRHSIGCGFLPETAPVGQEEVIEKSGSSGFAGTSLESYLKGIDAAQVVLCGFTANECIDATARDAAALGFSTCVVGDATAMFDMRSPDGKLLKAERLHRLTLANIGAYYAEVRETREILLG